MTPVPIQRLPVLPRGGISHSTSAPLPVPGMADAVSTGPQMLHLLKHLLPAAPSPHAGAADKGMSMNRPSKAKPVQFSLLYATKSFAAA